MLFIRSVASGSPAGRAGLAAGFRLLSINRRAVHDELDLRFAQSGEDLRLLCRDAQGRRKLLRVRKHPDQDLGLKIEETPIRGCGARCVFCFAEQNPPGLRPSLYFKDEDFRLSFLHGAYVSLANLKEKDLARILRQRLSPLYVSVHATDRAVRGRLLGVKHHTDILSVLKRLAEGRIQTHCQVVVVPGYNDGAALEKTVRDLAALHPWVASVALVPVGLTRHRQGLARLRLSSRKEALELLGKLKAWQPAFLKSKGTRLVFAADEWYLRAGKPLPAPEAYEDFPQAANGVGLIRSFEDQWAARAGRLSRGRGTLVTGLAFGSRLKKLARGSGLEILAVPNRFFGPAITVAGLLCGRDILGALQKSQARGPVLVPDVMLRYDGKLFLDGMSLADLERELGREVIKVPAEAKGFIKKWNLVKR